MERIWISSVDEEIKTKLRNLARNSDQSTSLFMRKTIREITEKYKHLDFEKPNKNKKSEISINGISKEVKKSLQNITDNMGVTDSELIRMEIFRIIEQASPDRLRYFQD